ncbi:Uncharacterized protein TCM_010283 [Theobroma cacao]|uniref:Uncharacterized protein n=1 Tax=Theobroma cacao TaxID=3641 RepID=A0A061EDQ6_THECC|nr:Uncharacterized protein TCM_010283 [Theobroma cacao]
MRHCHMPGVSIKHVEVTCQGVRNELEMGAAAGAQGKYNAHNLADEGRVRDLGRRRKDCGVPLGHGPPTYRLNWIRTYADQAHICMHASVNIVIRIYFTFPSYFSLVMLMDDDSEVDGDRVHREGMAKPLQALIEKILF